MSAALPPGCLAKQAPALLRCRIINPLSNREAGLDVPALQEHVRVHGGVAGYSGADHLSDRGHFWSLDCDMPIPAALEQQINGHNAGQITAKILLEGANGPTTLAANRILYDKGVLVVPDIIANAGGVTVSYFEWVQDFPVSSGPRTKSTCASPASCAKVLPASGSLRRKSKHPCAPLHSLWAAPACCKRAKCGDFTLEPAQ